MLEIELPFSFSND